MTGTDLAKARRILMLPADASNDDVLAELQAVEALRREASHAPVTNPGEST